MRNESYIDDEKYCEVDEKDKKSYDSLVHPGETAVYVQREDFYKLVGIGVFNEPARFAEPKPYFLSNITDDNWAALTLRVDPLARKILDPRKSYCASILLYFLVCGVFSTIKPTVNLTDLDSYDDDVRKDKFDDYYIYDNDDDAQDDVLVAEANYREFEISTELKLWKFWYILVCSTLMVFTISYALLMEKRNYSLDKEIQKLCEEISPRFQAQGYSLKYRSYMEKNVLRGHLLPERVIVFRKLENDKIDSESEIHDTIESPNNGSSNIENPYYRIMCGSLPKPKMPTKSTTSSKPPLGFSRRSNERRHSNNKHRTNHDKEIYTNSQNVDHIHSTIKSAENKTDTISKLTDDVFV